MFEVCNYSYDLDEAAKETGVSRREAAKAWRQAKRDARKVKFEKKNKVLLMRTSFSRKCAKGGGR